tara:strand:+ start:2193 stop:3047 length:855 start_codon:yes stop_codon:yes gene_type:complete
VEHALVLVTLNADYTDSQGNKYPKQGEFIHAPNFLPDKRLNNGLWGVLWGKTLGFAYLKNQQDSIWAVIKIDFNQRYVHLDKIYNLVKFEQGLVLHTGSKGSCAGCILKYKEDNGVEDLLDYQIAGNIIKAALPNLHSLCFGYSGQAISDISGLHAITAAIDAQAITTKPASNALSLAEKGRAITLEDDSYAVALGAHSLARTCGKRSLAVVLGTNSKAICSGTDSIALCLSAGCEVAVGPGGVIIMVYLDNEEHQQVLVESADHSIVSNRLYHYEDNHLSLIS